MAITIWCPRCNKRYTLPERDDLAKKRVRCKNCDHQFRVGQAAKQPQPNNLSDENALREPTSPKKPPKGNQERPELATAINDGPPRSPQVTDNRSSRPGQAVDMSQYFLSSSYAIHPKEANPIGQTSSTTTHVRNPMMIAAVLGAIGLSVLLALAAGAVRITNILAHNRAAEETSQPDFSAPDVPTTRADSTPTPIAFPPPFVPGERPLNAAELQTSIQHQQLEIERQMRRDLTPPYSQYKAAAGSERLDADFEQNRMADFERKQAREKRRLEEQQDREQERNQRDKQLRLAAERKLNLQRLEDEADNRPSNGLLARIPIEHWGAQSLVIGDKPLAFIGSSDGVSVYDWKRNRYVFDTKGNGGVDRVECLTLNPKETMLAAGGSDGIIELFKVGRSGKLKSNGTLDLHSESITHLIFTPDGSQIVSVDNSGKIVFWNAKKGSAIKSQSHFSKQIIAIQTGQASSHFGFSDGEKWAVFGSADGELVNSGTYPFRISSTAILLPDNNAILQATGSRLQLLDEQQPDPILEWQGKGVQWTITYAGGKRVLTGGRGHVYQWSIVDGALERVWAMPDAGYIKQIVVSPDEKTMAVTSGSARQDVYIFDLD